MTTTHAITFTGELLDGFERAEVMARFAARFGLKGAQVDKVFCGQPVTLKKGLDEAKARAYVKTLNELGMRTVSSSPFDVTEAPASAGYSILFDGSVLGDYDRDVVKRTAAQRLKFSDAQRDRLFSGTEVTMKRGLDEEKARHYVKTLRLLGMNARVEPALPEPATAAAPASAPDATPTPTPEPASTAAPTPAAATDTPASAGDKPVAASPKPHIAPKKAAADEAESTLSAAEASLMVTQFSPVPAYDLENTFHSSSTLDAASIGEPGSEGDAALHEALRESPLAKPTPAAAESAPTSESKPSATGPKDNMMATVVNPDALKDYEDALGDDPSIDALRAEHDPAPKKTTPEAAADAIKAAAAKSGAAAATTSVDLGPTGAKSAGTPTAAKGSDAKTTTNVDKRDAASPVHEQDTVLAELDTGRTTAPATPTPAPEPEAKKTSHTVLVVLIVIAAAAAAWLLLST